MAWHRMDAQKPHTTRQKSDICMARKTIWRRSDCVCVRFDLCATSVTAVSLGVVDVVVVATPHCTAQIMQY